MTFCKWICNDLLKHFLAAPLSIVNGILKSAVAPQLETIGEKCHHSLLEVLNVKLAYMPSCIPPEVHLINVFFVVIIVKKCIMASSRSRFLYCIEAR